MYINISSDFSDLVKALRTLPDKIQGKVLVPALKDVSKLGRTQAIRGITSEFNIDRPTVSSSFSIQITKENTLLSNGITHKAELVASSGRRRAFNAVRFMERKIFLSASRKRSRAGTKNQIHIRVLKTGSFKTLGKNAFLGNKGRTVFRVIPGTKKLEPISTIGVSQMFSTRRINEVVLERMRDNLVRYIDYSLQRIANNLRGS